LYRHNEVKRRSTVLCLTLKFYIMESNYIPTLFSAYQPSFSNTGILSYLLGSLFGGWGGSTTFPTIPEVSSEDLQAYYNKSKDASDEEKKELAKKYLDPEGIMEKYFEKLKDPIQFAKLNSKLIKLDAKIAVINKKKQDIVDE